MRGQANLLALGVALVAVTGAMVVGLAIADGAFAAADGDATERQLAAGVSERLVDADGPLATRANVLNASAVQAFDADALRSTVPGLGGRSVRVTLNETTLAATGDADGYSIERLVLVERTQSVTVADAFDGTDRTVTLPRRTGRVDVYVDPMANATVTTMRIGPRIVRHNESGLTGEFAVTTSRYRTATVSVDADGVLASGDIELTYYPKQTEKALLEVAVDE
ncbi:hypothetical protein SAMN06269185_1842 [Natronoarchaeum philippinense]|uniref:Uncharacterized protein n=1 Tax=Natronoarchaeum philippinense TaxID=558529 RepID=A0A285NYB5_NATPI|nr:hypothetical protein [Natronoarchaeum philippinense]SNZ12631.1 hypothetical protein SAMN06269185_1842 [Natronoarchaeum philippinense]